MVVPAGEFISMILCYAISDKQSVFVQKDDAIAATVFAVAAYKLRELKCS
jgi:hypothetical protein